MGDTMLQKWGAEGDSAKQRSWLSDCQIENSQIKFEQLFANVWIQTAGKENNAC